MYFTIKTALNFLSLEHEVNRQKLRFANDFIGIVST
jgi:hypothetical protein